MYSNNIVNFQESTTILNACTKKVWKLIEGTMYIYLYMYIYIYAVVFNRQLSDELSVDTGVKSAIFLPQHFSYSSLLSYFFTLFTIV